MFTRFLAQLAASALALVVLARLIPEELNYTSAEAVAVFAIVLALLNTFVRPVLRFITLPLTCLTLGLFVIVVNAVVFYVAARLSVGIEVTYLGALIGTLTVSVLTAILSGLFRDSRGR